jgi:predicted dehydrogenase
MAMQRKKMHTLLILNPGHFHAGLVLRKSHPSLSENIYVYSESGPDLDRFKEMAESFNQRSQNPTHWKIHVYTGNDYLQKLIDEKKGDIVVLAGKNDTRMQHIETLNRAGFCVLADKPWITTENTLPLLHSAMGEDRPLTLDIMTERFEITTLLLKEFLGRKEVFGDVRLKDDGNPSIYKETVHHLYKIVNEKPLVRPPWFFDTRIQGDGIIDVSTHLVDMTHWMLFPKVPIHFENDIELLKARRWPTRIPLEMYQKITQCERFPESVNQDVTKNELHYYCNGDIFYRVRGIPVHIRVLWNLEIPEGGGDTHYSYLAGTRSDLLIRQCPESGFQIELLIVPRGSHAEMENAVKKCLDDWADAYPGLSVTKENEKFLINIPDGLRTTHEEHFCQVRDAFLKYVDAGSLPPESRACIVSKYTLLAEARKLAYTSPFQPMEAPPNKL